MRLHGRLSKDTVVGAPAAMVWDVYRGVELGRLVTELLSDVIGKVEVIQGDGSVGTILKLTYPPGTPGACYLKEVFTKVDDEARVKETEIIEGKYKDLGFDLFRFRLDIIEIDVESTVIRSSMEYECDDKLANIASELTTKPLETIAEAIGKYLSEKKSTA